MPAADATPTRAPRLRALDALRLLAAAAVVLFHFTARDHGNWGETILPVDVFPTLAALSRYGYAGVHLFFVLSGFVILMSLWGRSVPQFVASRVSRLYPAYWVAVLLTATLLWLWPGFGAPTVGQVLVNLTMFHEPLGVASIDGVYWTLWVEMQFYLLMLAFLVWGVTARRVMVVATVAPVAGALVALLLPAVDARLTIAGWAPLFCAGMALYVIYRDGSSVRRWAVVALNAGLGALVSALKKVDAIEAVASGGTISPLVLAVITIAAIAVVAVVALVPRLRDLDWPVLTALGTLTYPLYLTHEYVGWAVIAAAHEALGPWPTLLLALLVCVGLAWVIHRFVERPWHRRLRGWVERRLTRGERQPDPQPTAR